MDPVKNSRMCINGESLEKKCPGGTRRAGPVKQRGLARKGKPTVNYKGAGASANFEQIVFVNFKEAWRPNWAKGPSEH